MKLYSVSLAIILTLLGYGYSSTQVTTVLLVRHAEKAKSPSDNPPLTESGQARAEELARVAGAAEVKSIYATQYIRTQQTVEPLAKQLGITIKKVDAGDIKGLVNRILSENAGETVLFAGHSNTLPAIVEAFGASPIPPIADDEHDNLYVVTVYEPGKAKVVRLKYGK
jgi:broad specificity phosphatase PhoE